MNPSPQIEQVLNPALVPIKILCRCGQKYAFDVEPSRGRMAYSVQCPICGLDGTSVANHLIAQHLDISAPKLRISEPELPPQAPPLPRLRPAWQAQAGASAKSKFARKLLIAAISGLVVLVVVLAATMFWRLHPQPPIAAHSGDLVNDGFPHTLRELDVWYAQPLPGQNAATVYSQGFDALQIANVQSLDVPLLGKGTLPSLGSPVPVSMKAVLAGVIRSNKDALQFFARGTELEQSRYPVDLSKGVDAAFPHLIQVKNAAQLVVLAGLLHAENREGKQAGQDALSALALARSLSAEPAMISQSVRAQIVHKIVEWWEQTANRTSVPRETLSDLQKALNKMEDYESSGEAFKRGLASERLIWLSLLGSPQKLLELVSLPEVIEIPAEQRYPIIARLQKGGNLKDEQQFFETTFQQLMAARKEPFPERLKADTLIQQRLSDAAQKKLLLMSVLLPGFAGAAAREAGCLAALRLGLTAVALERFRAANGNRYPAALTELTPQCLAATPIDPFDGQPLRYAAKGLGYVLYSIGPDLKNDSGRRMSGKDGDIVFAVISPPGLAAMDH
jgi:hypothetical protein